MSDAIDNPVSDPMGDPTHAPIHQPVIDLAILAEVIGNDPARLQKFASKFVDTTTAALTELQACAANGDIGRMRELGHRVKSSARIVGALGMGELCEQLEKLPAKEADAELAQARALVAQIATLLERIVSALASPSSASPPTPS